MASNISVTLSIAGYDATAGAGVLADVKTINALGGYGIAAVTAITVQNSVGVSAAYALAPEQVQAQLVALFEDFTIDAVKIGMLAQAEIIEVVAEILTQFRPNFIVIDPLINASSGYPLIAEAARKILCQKLFPLATIITPNLPEAAQLCALPVSDPDSMQTAAKRLIEFGPRAVLVKGGHLDGAALDLLFDGESFTEFTAARLDYSAHGTGCALSAAIAALLAQGLSLTASVARAKEFVTAALLNAHQLGKGARLLALNHRETEDTE